MPVAPEYLCGIHRAEPHARFGYANDLIFPVAPIGWGVDARFGPFPADTVVTHLTYWSGERCERIFTAAAIGLRDAQAGDHVTVIWTAGGHPGRVPPDPSEALRA